MQDTMSDDSNRERLLTRFAAYLDGLDRDGNGRDGEETAPHNGAGQATGQEAGDEAADLFSIFVELAGMRTEVRTQSRIVKEALDRFRSVFDTLSSSHATLEQELKRARADAQDRERALVTPLLLDIIDVRDRLAAGLRPAAAPPRRWFRRLISGGRPAAEEARQEAWQEGTRMTLRRLERILADHRVTAIETMGRPLDPRHAVAVATVVDAAAAHGVVVEEVRPGFLWNGEPLRPAEVIVARHEETGDK